MFMFREYFQHGDLLQADRDQVVPESWREDHQRFALLEKFRGVV